MDLSDLYSEKIIELAANAPQMPRIAAPDATARRVSRVCGSVIEIDIVLENGVVRQFGQTVRACALGQTSAAVVARHIVGTPVEEFRQVTRQMRAMLLAHGSPPAGRWADLRYLEPVRDYPNRHASTLLVFDAVCDAFDRAEKGGVAP